MIDAATPDLSGTVADAMRKLSRVEHLRGVSLVSMPSLYPSGASVVLEVSSGHNGRFFVSDRGGGHLEAELMGAHRAYGREAERVAEQFGIRFDGRQMFVAEASIGSLPAVLKIVAHCSQFAANATASRMSERVKVDIGAAIYERLVSIFPAKRVAKDAEIKGPSSHEWHVSALVTGGRQAIVFDAIADHPTSAVWTVAKFGDLARLENPPRRIAVASDQRKLGNMIGVIAPASTAVIDLRASKETILQLEAA